MQISKAIPCSARTDAALATLLQHRPPLEVLYHSALAYIHLLVVANISLVSTGQEGQRTTQQDSCFGPLVKAGDIEWYGEGADFTADGDGCQGEQIPSAAK